MDTFDMAQITVAFITTAGTIICALLGKKEQENQKINVSPSSSLKEVNRWVVGMVIGIVLLAANLVLLGWRNLEPKSTTEVRISYPSDGTIVDQTETIKGNSQKVPSTSVIWVVIFVPQTGRYYPQNIFADLQADGRWSSLVYFGQLSNTGLKFDVLAVLADKNAQNDFDAYLKTARDKSDFPGLSQLPKGTTIYDRITVTRK